MILRFTKGIMLEGISCAGKTTIFKALKKLHAEDPDSEISIIALGEHYSQVLNRVNNELVRLDQDSYPCS